MKGSLSVLPANLLWRSIFRQDFRGARSLDAFTRLSPGDQRLIIWERLLAQIRYFGDRGDALPEWREAAKARTWQELSGIWADLPIVTKETLRRQFPPEGIRDRFGVQGHPDASGGSTGEPTRFLHDAGMIAASGASTCFGRQRMGWRPGMPTIILWGSERDLGRSTPLLKRISQRLLSFHMLDGYRIHQETLDRCAHLIRLHRPVAMYGFTSILTHVAREFQRRQITFPQGSVQAAWNGGEMLFQDDAELFRSVFGVPLLNCYGGRELGLMACQWEGGGPMRVVRPYLMLEVVDDRGRPVEPGSPGRLLWTSTVCRGTPFLRYEIGDIGSYVASDCDLSGIHQLRQIEGRIGSVLILPNGRAANMLFWNHLFKEFPEVHQFQIRLRADRSVLILLKGEVLAPGRQGQLEGMVHGFLGDTPVTFRQTERIPLTSQGKLIQVVREGDGTPSTDGSPVA